jgi:hypothetical protein
VTLTNSYCIIIRTNDGHKFQPNEATHVASELQTSTKDEPGQVGPLTHRVSSEENQAVSDDHVTEGTAPSPASAVTPRWAKKTDTKGK